MQVEHDEFTMMIYTNYHKDNFVDDSLSALSKVFIHYHLNQSNSLVHFLKRLYLSKYANIFEKSNVTENRGLLKVFPNYSKKKQPTKRSEKYQNEVYSFFKKYERYNSILSHIN